MVDLEPEAIVFLLDTIALYHDVHTDETYPAAFTYGLQEQLQDVLDADVDSILRAGRENPLPRGDAQRLIRRTLETMRRSARQRGDSKALASLAGDLDAMTEEILNKRKDMLEGE